MQYLDLFNEYMGRHERLRSRCISLLAGQNTFSREVAALIGSDLGNRVVESIGDEQLFPGMDEYLQIETLGKDLCRDQLGAEDTDLRPVTGTIANFILYRALLEPSDCIASASLIDGAHVSASARTLKHLGYQHLSLPFSAAALCLDVEEATKLIRQRRPRLIMLGGSVVLFHESIKALSEIAEECGSVLAYDASHTIGLILSGHAPNPISQGCQIMTFTTSKTVPGPQHAIICGRQDIMRKVSQVSRVWHSGYHLHEVAAAVYALIEAVSAGPSYGEALVKNAKRLARELDSHGVPVVKNSRGEATDTYMLLADVRALGGGRQCERRLADAGILVNRNFIPGVANQSALDPYGLRFGVAEVTRMGMLPSHMSSLAELVSTALCQQGKLRLGTVADFLASFPRPSGIHDAL